MPPRSHLPFTHQLVRRMSMPPRSHLPFTHQLELCVARLHTPIPRPSSPELDSPTPLPSPPLGPWARAVGASPRESLCQASWLVPLPAVRHVLRRAG
eukprot:scaffold14965_cov48-Isochrysis_galbana.AAC.1